MRSDRRASFPYWSCIAPWFCARFIGILEIHHIRACAVLNLLDQFIRFMVLAVVDHIGGLLDLGDGVVQRHGNTVTSIFTPLSFSLLMAALRSPLPRLLSASATAAFFSGLAVKSLSIVIDASTGQPLDVGSVLLVVCRVLLVIIGRALLVRRRRGGAVWTSAYFLWR